MALKLYNSLSHEREDFIPLEPGKVKMYTCGPTVYHFAHIGNLRTYIMEDVLEKYLNYSGMKVRRVRRSSFWMAGFSTLVWSTSSA